MSAFEFFFSFYSLMLGLALANIAAGFGRLWRVRSTGSTGWCVPLLAVLILLRVVSSWATSWGMLQDIEISAATLLIAVGVALPYVVVSTLMFPDDGRDWPDLDAYYMSHSRVLLIVLAVSALVGQMGVMLVIAPTDLRTFLLTVALLVGPLAVMLVWRRLWVHRIMLILLVFDELRYLVLR